MKTIRRGGLLAGLGLLIWLVAGLHVQAERESEEKKSKAEAATPEQIKFFEQQVEPILKKNCFGCHGESKHKGGLRLVSRAMILQGGDSGSVVSLESPDESLLLEAINYDGFEMPPKGKLPDEQIEILTRWVKMGLPWTAATADRVIKEHKLEPPVDDVARRFWSFQRVQRPELPPLKNAAWVQTPIDAFILAQLEAAGLAPNPRAPRTALLRRAYYDLTGLPPSPAEVQAFLDDDSPQAFEKVVDRLLESPHYGERWGRHWLDLVRYAETNSYERDGAKPFVWRYRDYVIRSLNEDKPMDQFFREQIAGDELPEVTPDSIIATGYYRLGIWQDEPVDPVQELYEDLDDIVSTTGQVFLGLTINCCRCHDHKLDPLPQRDYYRFMAFFHGLNRYGVRSGESVAKASLRSIASPQQQQEQQREAEAHQQKLEQVRLQIKQLEDLVRADFEPVEKQDFRDEQRKVPIVKKRVGKLIDETQFQRYVALREELSQLKRFKPPALEQALCVTERGREPRETFVLIRGSAHAKGDRVEPGFPEVLGFPDPKIPTPGPDANSSGRRRALAEWITRDDNPLTARVLANRVWQFHFGRGIVASPHNFGFQGQPPTHPQLLDWLASELVAGDWKLKRLHKQIMMSATYQLSSRGRPEALEKDPENLKFWRHEMRRLSAEEVRDSILAVNGSLNTKMFGPSIYPEIPAEVKHGQSQPGAGWGTSSPEERVRRSIYVHIKRSLILPMFAAFDGADADATCPVRFVTTQPTQALGMLNGQQIQTQSKTFADFLRKHAGDKPADQVELALRRAFQRPPSKEEVQRGLALLDSLQTEHQLDASKALDYYCLVVLNLNEFMYLD